jgi:phenylacetate-CoA ligase
VAAGAEPPLADRCTDHQLPGIMSTNQSPSSEEVARRQASAFDELIREILAHNPFYREKLAAVGFAASRPLTLADLSRVPFTLKHELVEDQAAHPPFGRNLTYPIERYTRLHMTSGTTGRPMRWLDTPESWQWWLDCWKEVYRAAGVRADDRVFVAFSFGPFVGFWTAFEAGQQLGLLMLAGGGLSSKQRLETLLELEATVLVSTPTYALRLAELAAEQGYDLPASAVRLTIHAGEPGASVPNVRRRIEQVWGARCVDHAGATEVGAWGFGCGVGTNMHVNELAFVSEVIDPETLEPAPTDPGAMQSGELVLTNLGRAGSPLLRYRTGDLVDLVRGGCPCGRSTAYLRGGVKGRIDGMVVVRGINVFPSALENLVREFPEITEFEVTVERHHEMAELAVRIEVIGESPARTAQALQSRIHRQLSLRPRVDIAEAGSLPRYELKARRFKVG